jgi:nucleoside triphosphate diphosphatase
MREMTDLLDLLARLRDPEHGCPRDRAQTYATLVPHTIEPTKSPTPSPARTGPICGTSWGDLLFQVV